MYTQFINDIDELEDKINKENTRCIDEVYSFIKSVDAIEFLSYFTFMNYLSFNPDGNYSYVTPAELEYISGVFLSTKYDSNLQGKGELNDFGRIIELVKDQIRPKSKLSMTLKYTKNAKSESDIYRGIVISNLISDFTSVRGYSFFPSFNKDKIIKLFAPFNKYIEKEIGFNIDSFFSYIGAIELFYQKKMEQLRNKITTIMDINKDCSDIDEQDLFAISHYQVQYKDLFSFTISELIKQSDLSEVDNSGLGNFLNFFSTNVGIDNNENYTGFSDDNIFKFNPIFKINKTYFIPSIINIIWILKEKLEGIIQKDSKVWNKYIKNRSSYLEEKSLHIIKTVLPDCIVHQSAYYTFNNKDYEADGIILYDTNIILIEAKAGIFHNSAKKGGLKRLEKNISENIEKAYDQAIRTKNYIESETKTYFRNKKGKQILEIERSQFTSIYTLNITLDYFAELSLNYEYLNKSGLYKSENFPISLTLQDLSIISDFKSTPSEFFHYLDIRNKVYNLGKNIHLKNVYELDLLGLSLYDEDENLEEYFTEDINELILMKNIILKKNEDERCIIPDFSPIFNK